MTTDKPTGAEITEAAKELGIDLDGADMDTYHATALDNFGVYAGIDAEDDDPGLAFRGGNRDWVSAGRSYVDDPKFALATARCIAWAGPTDRRSSRSRRCV